jgi:hypothetical protein
MKNVRVIVFLFAQAFVFGAFAGNDPQNVQPYQDSAWLKSSCRFRVLKPDGAYGAHDVKTLDGCINAAEIGLMVFAQTASDKKPFHMRTEVEYVDETGQRHVCRVNPRTAAYDRLPPLTPDQVNQPGFYDGLSFEFKRLLDENFSDTCS